MREALELVGLAGTERRDVTTLSGGEAQRVALARALAPRPEVLLLDEPLGALDGPLRRRLQTDLRELFERLRLTVVHVTHDVGEAFELGDRVAVLRDGRVAQVATPDELWARPADDWVARFLGMTNVVPDGDRATVVRPEAVRVRPRARWRRDGRRPGRCGRASPRAARGRCGARGGCGRGRGAVGRRQRCRRRGPGRRRGGAGVADPRKRGEAEATPAALRRLAYSHSIVAGGLELRSSATRLTPGTSLTMRLEIASSSS